MAACDRCGLLCRRDAEGGPALCGWCSGVRGTDTIDCSQCGETLRCADPSAGDMDQLNSGPADVCLRCR
ncbi:MAG: hypothetical protein J4G04_08495 [Nitrosopumilaceae archaeon]|nr:hypothetical protein [Nitrosopumilaceae archaeon]